MELEEVVRKATQALSEAEKAIAEQLRVLSRAVNEYNAVREDGAQKGESVSMFVVFGWESGDE